jgi:hypothetical protein
MQLAFGLGFSLAEGVAGISPSASSFVYGAAQGTTIGVFSGGAGPYTITDANSYTQMNADGVTLEVGVNGPTAPVGTFSVTAHDTGTPAAPDKAITITVASAAGSAGEMFGFPFPITKAA